MKTIDDAVKQYKGVWPDSKGDAMAWLYGGVDCVVRDARSPSGFRARSGGLLLNSNWKLICTRAEFDRRAAEMGYWVESKPLQIKWGDEWVDARRVGYYKGEEIYAWESVTDDGNVCIHTSPRLHTSGVRTRPSERERWVEAARKASESRPEVETYDAIYDAGLAKVE